MTSGRGLPQQNDSIAINQVKPSFALAPAWGGLAKAGGLLFGIGDRLVTGDLSSIDIDWDFASE